MTDERFERGRKVAQSLNNRAVGFEDPVITGTGISEDNDLRYFIDRAIEGNRRKEQRRSRGDSGSRRGHDRRSGKFSRREFVGFDKWRDRRKK